MKKTKQKNRCKKNTTQLPMNIIQQKLSKFRRQLISPFNKESLQEYLDKLDDPKDKLIIVDGYIREGFVPNIVLGRSCEKIKFLIENNANVNIHFKINWMDIDNNIFTPDNNIFTPLLWEIILSEDLDIVNTLIEFGANIYERDMKNRTVFYYAKEMNKMQIFDLLIKNHNKNTKKIKKVLMKKTKLNSDCIQLIINYLYCL